MLFNWTFFRNKYVMAHNILICGDSFAADWTVKRAGIGWPNLLAKDFSVTNLAQAGCSEYKIFKQITSVDITAFSHVIISHTSPLRLVVREHPVHKTDSLHHSSDLIYADIKEHSKKFKNLLPIVDYFENYFDMESAVFMHTLLCEKICSITNVIYPKIIHVVNSEWSNLYQFKDMLNFAEVHRDNPGYFNHYSAIGNHIIYDIIKQHL